MNPLAVILPPSLRAFTSPRPLRSGRAAPWLIALPLLLALLPGARAQETVGDIINAAQKVGTAGFTKYDEALVLKNIKQIHQLRAQGRITDAQYQNVMSWHQVENGALGRQAGAKTGLIVSFQQVDPTAGAYRTGSDTDFHVRRKDGKPVTLEDIQAVERAYRVLVNEEVKKRSEASGKRVNPSPSAFNTDTDFMAATDGTSEQEFKRIAEYFKSKGADVYTRYAAAQVESQLRSGAPVTLEGGHQYMEEMQDQAAKKQGKIDKLKAQLAGATGQAAAELQGQINTLEYERNKYIARITKVSAALAAQAGAPPPPALSTEGNYAAAGRLQFAKTLGAIAGSSSASPEMRSEAGFLLALRLHGLPSSSNERGAILRELEPAVATQVKAQLVQFSLLDKTREDPSQLQRLRAFLEKTQTGQKMVAHMAWAFDELTRERSRATSSAQFLQTLYSEMRATGQQAGNRAMQLSMLLGLAEQVRAAKTDSELAIAVGKTLASRTYYGLIASYIYTGVVEQDGAALAKGLIILFCPEAAIPDVVKAIGDSAIAITTSVAFDKQLMALYLAARFDPKTGDLLGIGSYNGPGAPHQFLDDALLPGGYNAVKGLFDEALALAKQKNLSVEVLGGLNAVGAQALVRALDATVINGEPLVMKEDGRVQEACAQVRTVTSVINDFVEGLGFADSVPRQVDGSWSHPNLEPSAQRKLKELLVLRSQKWADVKQALGDAIRASLETRYRAEKQLGEGDQKALEMLAEIEQILRELGIYNFGMAAMDYDASFNFIQRAFFVSAKEQKIKAMEVMQRYKAAYSAILALRETAESVCAANGGGRFTPRLLTGTPPLTADPDLDRAMAVKFIQTAVKQWEKDKGTLLWIKRDGLNDNLAGLDSDFDKRILREYCDSIMIQYNAEAIRDASARAGQRLQQVNRTAGVDPGAEIVETPWGWQVTQEQSEKSPAQARATITRELNRQMQLLDEFKEKYKKQDGTLVIRPPAAVLEERAEAQKMYVFRVESRHVPAEAVFTWFVNGREGGKGGTISHAFAAAGIHTVTVVAAWVPSARVKRAGTAKAELRCAIGAPGSQAGREPVLTIVVPAELAEGKGVTGKKYSFGLAPTNIPDSAVFSWFKGLEALPKGKTIELTFAEAGRVDLSASAEWAVAGEAAVEEVWARASFTIGPAGSGAVRIEGPATAKAGEEVTLTAVIPPTAGLRAEDARYEWKGAEKKPGGKAVFKQPPGEYTAHLDVYVQDALKGSADHPIKVTEPPVEIRITQPADGTETSQSTTPLSFTMTGHENVARVSVIWNGNAAQVPVGPAFTEDTQALVPGDNTFVVEAATKDGKTVRSAPVRIKSTQSPENRFRFHMKWQTEDTDIDLHLSAPGGGHCFYGNKPTDFAELDDDDQHGPGDEIITLRPLTREGRYRLYIHYYADNMSGRDTPPATPVSVTLLDGARPVQTWNLSLGGVGDEQTVMTFDWGVTVEILPPPKKRVIIGETMALEVKAAAPQGANLFGTATPAGKMTYLWLSDNNVAFSPDESEKGRTVARFTRPGKTRIHVAARTVEGGSQKVVARSEDVEIEVVPPGLTLEFEPAEPCVGQEVTARVVAEPPLPKEALRFQWYVDGPTVRYGAKEAGAYVWEYTFTPKKPEPIRIRAEAITTEGDDDAGEAVKTCTARLYEIQTAVKGAVFSPTPAKPRTDFNTDEHVEVEASIAPTPDGDVRWRWTANEGTTLTADISKTARAYRHEPGVAMLTVTARNGDDVILGTGTVSFTVVEGGTGPKASQKKMDEARKAWAAGEIDKAVTLAGEAQTANPKDEAIRREADQMRKDRDAIKLAVRDGEALLGQKKLADAEKKADEALQLNGKYPPSLALRDKIAQAKKDMVDGWQREYQKAQTQYNAGDFAGAQATLAPVLKGIQESAGLAPPALAGQVQDLQKKIEAAIAQLKKVMAKSAEITGLLGQNKLQTAIKGQNDLVNLATGLPGDGAKRIKDDMASKIAAAQQKYNAFIGQKDQAHKAAADKLDWKAAKQAAEGKREWELAPADENKLKEQVATAERKIKEQDDALKAADAAEQQAGSGTPAYFLGGQADQAIQDLKQKQQLFGSWDPRRARFDQAIRKLETRKKGESLWSQAKNLYESEFPRVQDPYDTTLLEKILGLCKQSLDFAPVESRRGFLVTLETLIRERREKAEKKRKADQLWKQAKDLLENNGDMKTVESLCTQSVRIDPYPSDAHKDWLSKLQRANKLWAEGKQFIEPPKDMEKGLATCEESISLASNKSRRDFVAGLRQRRAQAQTLRGEGERIEQGGTIPDLQKALDKYRESLRLWPNAELEAYIKRLQAKLDGMIAEVVRGRERKYIFSNYNIDGVSEGSPQPPSFTVQTPQLIEFICTYHYNGAKGAQPGTIGLRDQSGRVYGPWEAGIDVELGGRWTNINWVVFPGITIPPGTYTVMDSETATWSYNSVSRGIGFARVGGFAQPVTVSRDCIMSVAMSGCGAGGTAVDENGVEHTYTFFQSSVTATVGAAQQARITVTMGDGKEYKAEGTGRAALTLMIPPNSRYTVHIQNLTATGHCESVQSFETDERGQPHEAGSIEKPKPPEWVKKVTAADFVGSYQMTDPTRTFEAYNGTCVLSDGGTGIAQEQNFGKLVGNDHEVAGGYYKILWQFNPGKNTFVFNWRTQPDRSTWGYFEGQISGESSSDFTLSGRWANGNPGQLRLRRTSQPPVPSVNLSGKWIAYQNNNKVADCEIRQDGQNLVFIITSRTPAPRSTGKFLDAGTVVATDWNAARATIRDGGQRLDWGDSEWVRPGTNPTGVGSGSSTGEGSTDTTASFNPTKDPALLQEVVGRWRIVINTYPGWLELNSGPEGLTGRNITDKWGVWVNLVNPQYDPVLKEIRFGQANSAQQFRGTLRNGALEGTFDGVYKWSATR
ncbi:MAG: hypothetical protein KA248_00295 [Kiritimatiellae bacterium]|nr:hypothetical protein [Kiritimatiellia bacterium]